MKRLFIITIALLLTSAPPALSADSHLGAERRDTFQIISDAKAEVFPAVVFIKPIVEKYERGEKETQEVTGSGVLISADGEIITNYHVVEKAVSIRCLLSDGRNREAEILGTDKDTDLALLKLIKKDPDESFPSASLGDSKALAEGDFVMAMGAPWGLNRSVSLGIVSCTLRYIPDRSEYSLWLQTDAALNPGNSGGPLVNTDGEVIGINTLASMIGGDLGFAIPSETLKRIIPQLRTHEKVPRAWTGLRLQALKDFNQNIYFDADEGFIVAGADPASPAANCDIKTGDRITAVNGLPVTVTTDVDLPAARTLLASLPPDQTATLEVHRNSSTLEMEITPTIKGKVEGEEFDCPRWNMTVKTINKFENPDLFFIRSEGVFIFGTKYPGNASSSGLRTNDIIEKIDSKPVVTLEDVKNVYEEVVNASPKRTRVVFDIVRNGISRQTVLDFAREYKSD